MVRFFGEGEVGFLWSFVYTGGEVIVAIFLLKYARKGRILVAR